MKNTNQITIEAKGAYLTNLWLILLPGLYLAFIPVFPWLVSVRSSWGKDNKTFWRSFSIISGIIGVVLGVILGAIPSLQDPVMAYVRFIGITGLVMLPHGAYSAMDTYENRKRMT